MTRLAGPLSVVAVVLFAIFFASQNGAERVTLNLGIVVLYGVPVTIVAFGGLLIGMLVMLGAGIQSDLKVRAILRQRLADQSEEDGEYVDTAQRDLFLHAPARDERPVHRIPEESRASSPPPGRPPPGPSAPAEPAPAGPPPDPAPDTEYDPRGASAGTPSELERREAGTEPGESMD